MHGQKVIWLLVNNTKHILQIQAVLEIIWFGSFEGYPHYFNLVNTAADD